MFVLLGSLVRNERYVANMVERTTRTRSTVGTTTGHAHQGPTEVERFTFTVESFTVAVLSYGAALESVVVPDRSGTVGDVCLSLGGLVDRQSDPYMGATIGRFANRIGGAAVKIDGRRWELVANEGPNQLHGGPVGFSHYVWAVDEFGPGFVRFRHVSPAGDMGFPGTVRATATYTITPSTVSVDLAATTDAPTIVSLTNHAYWNLGGPAHANTDDHLVTVPATTWLPVGPDLIPTARPSPVSGTQFDLRQPTALGSLVGSGATPSGIDHCLIVDGDGFRRHALIEHLPSGRNLEVWSDQPAAQIYGGGALPTRPGAGRSITARAGMCVEPQQLPRASDSSWAPPVLRPGVEYRHHIEFRFGISEISNLNFDT